MSYPSLLLRSIKRPWYPHWRIGYSPKIPTVGLAVIFMLSILPFMMSLPMYITALTVGVSWVIIASVLHKKGIASFTGSIDLHISPQAALQLCLAAGTEIQNARVTSLDEHTIPVKIRFTNWLSNIDFVIDALDGGGSVINICSSPLPGCIAVAQGRYHRQNVQEIVKFIKQFPDWDYGGRSPS